MPQTNDNGPRSLLNLRVVRRSISPDAIVIALAFAVPIALMAVGVTRWLGL